MFKNKGINYGGRGSSGVFGSVQSSETKSWDATNIQRYPPNFSSQDLVISALDSSLSNDKDKGYVAKWNSLDGRFFSPLDSGPIYDPSNYPQMPVRFSASGMACSSAASNFSFLHDGTSDYTIALVSSANLGSATQYVISNKTGLADVGFSAILFNVNTAGSRTLTIYVGNGASSQGPTTGTSHWFASQDPRGPHIFLIRYNSSTKNLSIRVGGAADSSQTVLITRATGSAANPLTIGTSGVGAVPLTGAISVFSVTNSYLSDNRCKDIEGWAKTMFGVILSGSS